MKTPSSDPTHSSCEKANLVALYSISSIMLVLVAAGETRVEGWAALNVNKIFNAVETNRSTAEILGILLMISY